jgi:hypothetical protein
MSGRVKLSAVSETSHNFRGPLDSFSHSHPQMLAIVHICPRIVFVGAEGG